MFGFIEREQILLKQMSSTPFCVSWSNSVMYILNRLEYYGFKLVG